MFQCALEHSFQYEKEVPKPENGPSRHSFLWKIKHLAWADPKLLADPKLQIKLHKIGVLPLHFPL